jgi:FtsP/CotA-like multicopper oxidase with cupredoxin domain
VTGGSVTPLPRIPAQAEPRDLRQEPVARRRQLTFAMAMAGGTMRFIIDGKEFDPNRIDQTVAVGTIEEWVITNTSPMDHPIHLHVWPMQLIEENGQQLKEPSWQDVVNIPARSNVKVRIAFEDFTGCTVYHCHILDHEDQGMMGVIDARK